MGAFGTGGHPRPNRRLTTDYPRLTLRVLPKLGETVVLRWQTLARALLVKISRTGEDLTIEMSGTTVRVALRSWPIPPGNRRSSHEYTLDRMVCPRCDASRNILHWGEDGWGCRGCYDLDFPCRHQQRWCPAIRRRQKLLRRLVRVSPRGLKARILWAQIAQQEAAMLASMKRANRDLTKRVKRHGGRR